MTRLRRPRRCPTIGSPSPRRHDRAGGEVGGDERAGHERRGRAPRTRAPPPTHAERRRRGSDEHAHLGQLAPPLAVDRTAGLLDGAHASIGNRPSQERAHAFLQGDLVVGELEVHQRSFGRPSMRSATMLRWICEVPAAMVIDSAWMRPLHVRASVGSVADVVDATATPGRAGASPARRGAGAARRRRA